MRIGFVTQRIVPNNNVSKSSTQACAVKANNFDTVNFSSNLKPEIVTPEFCVFKTKAGEIIKEFPDRLNDFIGQKNIVFIGGALTTPKNQKMIEIIEKIAEKTTSLGYNSINGAGSYGIMGASIRGADRAIQNNPTSKSIGKSLSVVIQGGWGDEDLVRTSPIALAKTGEECDRVLLFNKLLEHPDSAVICAAPGATTIQELTHLIAKNKYRDQGTPPRRIFLIGKEKFEPLKQFYRNLFNDGDFPVDPYDKNAEQLFEILEPEELLARLK